VTFPDYIGFVGKISKIENPDVETLLLHGWNGNSIIVFFSW